ncbi:MAG: bifunctional nicotinamidase/pyrazinamidase [Treponema sp.]|jgi:nicotinamidase/pyrazinamidase|nr:bifunctional nicotinamidase/pyrazinamidase [Treponema sp.]
MLIDISKTALVEIDIQNDFCPSYVLSGGEKLPAGALAVERGDEPIPLLNTLAEEFGRRGGWVAATADWHPPGHVSFASAHGKKPGEALEFPGGERQLLWPDHCVRGSAGAAFHEKLDLKNVNLIIRKGFRPGLDSYSAFFENDRKTPTGLEGCLKCLALDTVILGGLATDYCVLYSALDAARCGFRTIVLSDAVRGVGFPAGSVERAFESMKAAGVLVSSLEEVLQGLR